MNEAETRAELIDPGLKEAGWGVVPESRIKREVITLGRILGGGKRSKQDIADYVLVYKNQKLAVIEAKKKDLPDTEGVDQAKRYADKLQVRYTYSTNGIGIYQIDMETGKEGNIEKYPTPQELWDMTFPAVNNWIERFSSIPFEDKGGTWQARYYQHNAIENVLKAISDGKDRILLTLATGTGKTFIAFQLAWKLFQSKWNLKDWENDNEPSRRPRILFLADRNILANQAFNAFNAFSDDALVRIDPQGVRKKGSVPKNGSIFFTIFQTFMTGRDDDGEPAPYFGEYPPDFFDFIIIDECHRGGANDESNWRGIMEYFSPAVQLGLTATPKRQGNADTYLYFGEPVYVYSLKEGINDGFLTPFKVKQIATTLDDYVYTSDDKIIEGEIEDGRLYEEEDFNKIIEIKEREAYRVKLFMDMIDQSQKTLVFCATQVHALAVRDLINQNKKSSNPNYCVRVTADDGAAGETWLRTFQDNEKTIPTILTTSQKLSTGVDALNVRNIVLMRPVNSMIEFKQIIGRGTRLFDGKEYFTIYDFVKAYKHFNDADWDGEPIEPDPCAKCGNYPCTCAPEPCDVCGQFPCVCPPKPCNVCGNNPCTCVPDSCDKCLQSPCICPKLTKVKLADGKERTIQHMSATTFWGPDGKPVSAVEFIETLFGELPNFFESEEELIRIWGRPDTRRKLMDGLADKGFGLEQLADLKDMINAKDSDIFDVLTYIAYSTVAISRAERVAIHKERMFSYYDDRQQDFISFVLSHYIDHGVSELDQAKLPQFLELKYGTMDDAVAKFGSVSDIKELFIGFQEYLYEKVG